MISKYGVTTTLAISAVLMSPLVASANSTPNSYTSQGTSWVDIPDANKVYFEDFDEGTQDDTKIFYVEAGVTCVVNGVTATGPFLAGDDNTELSESDCTKAGSAFDPIDYSGSNRVGAVPIGFSINFFGTTYSDLFFNENGTVFFDAPDADYDDPVTAFAARAGSSIISVLGVDQYYDEDEGSLWVGNTTIDGRTAFVISWQQMDECCNGSTPDSDSASYQLVLIDYGSGDFVAYLNYDEFVSVDEGYNPQVIIDTKNGVTVGSNIVTVDTVAGLTPGLCDAIGGIAAYGSGTLDDNAFESGANYLKLVDSSAKTISVWSDSSCSVANNISVVQDISSGPEFLGFEPSSLSSFNSAPIGWATYNSSTGAIDTTEIFSNVDIDTLFNGGSSELIGYSLNTSVPGRIVVGQSGGVSLSADLGSVFAGSFEGPSEAAPVYAGPIPTAYSKSAPVAGDTVVVSGLRLGMVTGLSLDDVALTFTYDPAEGSVTFTLPVGLEPGVKNLVFMSSAGKLTAQDAFSVTAAPTRKVNAGSFKGYVAVYAKGYEGHRLSAKVGNDWVIVPEVPAATNDLYRHVEFTGTGYEILVRIYIDRELLRTVELVTR